MIKLTRKKFQCSNAFKFYYKSRYIYIQTFKIPRYNNFSDCVTINVGQRLFKK